MKQWEDMTEEERNKWRTTNDKLEMDSIHDGVTRYNKTISVIDAASKRPERVVIGNLLMDVKDRIVREQQKLQKGMASTGNPSIWSAPFISIKAERLALIVLSYMIQSPKQVSSMLCREVGEAVRHEVMLDEIRNINKAKTTSQKGFSRNESKKFIRNLPKIKKIYKSLSGNNLKWKLTSKIALGAKLIECVIEATGGWVVQVEFIKKNISKAYIVMNDELVEWINKYHTDLEIMRPVKMPMCVPPVDWSFRDEHGMASQDPTDVIDGGYRILKEDFITGRKGHHESNLKVSSMSQVFEAVNYIQNTQWRIDTKTLDILEHIMKLNSDEYSDIIPCNPVRPKLPPLPTEATARRMWHQNRKQQRSKWYAQTSQRIAAMKCIDVARRFKNMPIWFPHNIDFRGRIYPIASHISPQGSDIQKALLRYNHKEPIGNQGLYTLKVYAATVAGQDKISYDDRIKWFDENWLPQIKDREFDPFENTAWVSYDSPLIFLQAIEDISKAIRLKDPSKYMSDLSTCLDGSQNGIQHLSAVSRDEVGGKSVNLLHSELPADLYMDVALKVRKKILEDCKDMPYEKDKLGNDAPHLQWRPYFEDKKKARSIVKRSVMAFPYGITVRGMHDNLINDGFLEGLNGSIYHNANYLANVIVKAVQETVIQAAVLMDYLQHMASEYAKQGYPITWTSPLGLPITQRYLKEEAKVVQTCLHNCTFYVLNGKKLIDILQQLRGIVANWIHSLDASHAGYCALGMKDDKIRCVQFIHDSIGTHVCHIPRLHHIIRKTFINMHRIDLLQELIDTNTKLTGIKLQPPPKKGKLDLDKIYDSRWFFS